MRTATRYVPNCDVERRTTAPVNTLVRRLSPGTYGRMSCTCNELSCATRKGRKAVRGSYYIVDRRGNGLKPTMAFESRKLPSGLSCIEVMMSL